jgi:C4-dicarboxylate-specific signal transduction histidine kinase
MEVMAAAIAHELMQPVSAMATNASAALRWLGRTPPDHDEMRAALNGAVSESRRAREVLAGIRALFQPVYQTGQSIDFNDIALEVLQSLRGELKDRGITVHTEFMSKPPLIIGNQVQLQQVMVNLAQNAMEAMGSSTIRSRALWVRTALHSADAIGVTVEDSGPGIDPQKIDSIFEPFVTTKTSGTGLGLAISRMIIERHGGKISAMSDGKNGTRFQFVLPILSGNTAGVGATN